MRTVDYVRHEFHGEPEAVSAPLWAFVYDVPYLAPCNVFPPLSILNQILASGGSEGGMGPGATWAPFSISRQEYDALLPAVLNPDRDALQAFSRYPGQQMTIDPELDTIGGHLEWIVAVSEKHGHIPSG